jgi:hypothetical protein
MDMPIPGELLVKILPLFAKWYFVEVPLTIIDATRKYVRAMLVKFSVIFLIKTSYYPWKNLRQTYPDSGVQIKKILEAWGANMVARSVGFVIRMATAGMGLIIACIAGLVGMVVFLWWLGAPVWAVLIILWVNLL